MATFLKGRSTPGQRAAALAAASLILLAGCSRTNPRSPGVPTTGNRRPAKAADRPPNFDDVTGRAGIHYRWTASGKRPLNILQTIGNGCAFLDYNNDGNLDILLVGPRLALYEGNGHGQFKDVTHETGLDAFSGHFLGCAVGDYDNDGFEDIYISAYRGGLLLHNESGGRFRDVTRHSGIRPQPWGASCAFVDLDCDGKLDLYITNYAVFGPNTQPQLCDFSGVLSSCTPRFYTPEKGVLYHNEGGGRFRDVTRQWNAQTVNGRALGVACADYDGSGRQSIAIANDEMPGDLLRNRGVRFVNEGVVSGTAYDSESHIHGGMGIDWGDYDNDGRPDLVVATFQHEPTCIYHNEGGGSFTEDSSQLGIGEATAPYVKFGAKWLDYDNDGWLDLAFANGHVQDNIDRIDRSATYRQSCQLFHNNHGASFTDVSAEAGPAFQRKIVGRGLAVGDFDNDGRLDLLVVDSEGSPLLLQNECQDPGHWLCLKLVGVRCSRDAIGALVTVQAGALKQTRRCGSDGSYLSASDLRVQFGLGAATRVRTLTVHWPDGAQNILHDVPADRILTVRELVPR